MVAALMGRVWLVALAIILARYAGGKDDGIMAAALLLAAFTVYLAMSFITRDGPIQSAAAAHGKAEHLMSAAVVASAPALEPGRRGRRAASNTQAHAADPGRRLDRRHRRCCS